MYKSNYDDAVNDTNLDQLFLSPCSYSYQLPHNQDSTGQYNTQLLTKNNPTRTLSYSKASSARPI